MGHKVEQHSDKRESAFQVLERLELTRSGGPPEALLFMAVCHDGYDSKRRYRDLSACR